MKTMSLRTPRRRRTTLLGPVAAVAAGVLALSACSGSSTDNADASSGEGGGSAELEVWLYPTFPEDSEHEAFWDEKIEEFETANEGITVNYEVFPWSNRDEAIQTALAGGVAPDLIYLVPDQLSTYADSLEPLGDYLPEDQISALSSSVVDSLTLDGGMVGAPLLTSSDPLVCNSAVFEDVGVEPPSTWEDVRAAAPAFAEADKNFLAYWGSPDVSLNASFYPFLWQAGGSVFSDDGSEVTFNDAAGVDALEFLVDLNEAGVLEQDALTSFPALEQTGLATGDTACQYGSYQAHMFTDLWEEEDIMVLPPLEGVERVGYGTIGSLSMFSDSENKEAAGEFLSFATSQENVDEYVTASNYFSPYESSTGLYEEGSLEAATEKTTEYTTVGQLNPASRQVMGLISAEVQAALLDGKDPQQALDDAAAAAQPLL